MFVHAHTFGCAGFVAQLLTAGRPFLTARFASSIETGSAWDGCPQRRRFSKKTQKFKGHLSINTQSIQRLILQFPPSGGYPGNASDNKLQDNRLAGLAVGRKGVVILMGPAPPPQARNPLGGDGSSSSDELLLSLLSLSDTGFTSS